MRLEGLVIPIRFDTAELDKGIMNLQSVLGGAALLGFAKQYGDFIGQAVDDTLAWNNAALEMSQILGLTPLEGSKMLGFLDIFAISADDADMANRKLVKGGMTLTLDTLKLLAVQYQAINDPAEKQAFILENLGTNGYQFATALSLSNGRLQELYDSLPEGLQLTKESVLATEAYALQVNELDKNWLAFKMSIGNEIIPGLARMLTLVNNNWQGILDWGTAILAVIQPAMLLSSVIGELVEKLQSSGYNGYEATMPNGTAWQQAFGGQTVQPNAGPGYRESSSSSSFDYHQFASIVAAEIAKVTGT